MLAYTNNDDGSKDYALFGVFPSGHSLSFTGQQISINVYAHQVIDAETRQALQGVGIDAGGGSTVVLGGSGSAVSINVDSDRTIMGIRAVGNFQDGNSYVEINGDSFVLNAESYSERPDSSFVFGLLAQNLTYGETSAPVEERTKIVVNSENTYINVKSAAEGQSAALAAMTEGILEVNGNLHAVGDEAIVAYEGASVTINKNSDKTVQLVGDIYFNYDENVSPTEVDAKVVVNLSGPESYWKGNAKTSYSAGASERSLNMNISGLELGISNGAQWSPTLIEESSDPESGIAEIAVHALTLNDGIINLEQGGAQEIHIKNLQGTGGTVNSFVEKTSDGQFVAPRMVVESVVPSETAPTLHVNYQGITSDNLSDPQKDMETLASSISADGARKVYMTQEGNIRGAVAMLEDAAGERSEVTQSANVKLSNYSAVNAMGLVEWRNEINHLTKRLGDIRASEGTIGAWARVYGGESQWGGANEVEMDHTTIQAGGDCRINNHWIVGAAFSYTDSSADLSNGKAEGDTYSIAAYATYTAEGGSFLDLIARYGYLKNDITAGNMRLETGSSAFSLSAETGHTFRFLDERAYIEPQIEVTYGFIAGDDDTASNGVRIEQDKFENLITRVGVRAGFDFPEKKGSLYGMVSYSYDWLGDADGTASQGALAQELSQDLGGGWVTYGIGAQIMMGKSAYFYGELERTSGGDIENPYLFSAGVRWTF